MAVKPNLPSLTGQNNAAQQTPEAETPVSQLPSQQKKQSQSYYTRPDLGSETTKLRQSVADAEADAQRRITRANQAGQMLTEAVRVQELLLGRFQRQLERGDLESATATLSRMEGLQGGWENVQSAYDYAEASANMAIRRHGTEADRYNAYLQEQEARMQAWRSTIREPEVVRAELEQVDKQVQNLTVQDRLGKLGTMFSNAMGAANAASGGGNLQHTEAVANPELEALLARQALLREELEWGEYYRYDDLKQNPDFAENSAYRTTANGLEAVFNPISGTYSETGFDDPLYEYINQRKDAKYKTMLMDLKSGASFLGMDQSYIEQMGQSEINVFNYLYATQGKDTAYEYLKYLTGDLNRRQREEEEARWREFANEHRWASSALSVAGSPLKGLSFLGQTADYLADGKIDQNAGYNKFSYSSTAIRDEVSKVVEERWGAAGSFAYQTGMSMADNLMRSALLGGNQMLALAIMGTGAAADGVISAKDRGLSDDQAMLLGTIGGLAEAAIERLNLDDVMNPGALKDGMLLFMGKNALAEGGEEMLTELVNGVFDWILAGHESEWDRSIQYYCGQGMNEEEATLKTLGDTLVQMLAAGAGGAMAGGIMSGVTAWNATKQSNRFGTALDLKNATQDDIHGLIESGLESAEGTESRVLAERLQEKVAKGQTPTADELSRLAVANEIAIAQEGTENHGEELEAADHAGTETAGAGVSDGSKVGYAGTGTGEPSGGLAEGAGIRSSGETAERARAAADRQNRAADLQRSVKKLRQQGLAQTVSSKELGIPRGTDDRSMTLIPKAYYDPQMAKLSDRIYTETGYEAVFVTGRIPVMGSGNAVSFVRGVLTNDRIIVQADNYGASAEQLADHEAYHAKNRFSKNAINREVKQYIRENFTEEEFVQVLEQYVKELRCVYDLDHADTPEAEETIMDMIEEEVFADAYAGINAYGAGADRFGETVNRKMDELHMGKQTQQENGTEQPTGPPEDHYSSDEIPGLSLPTLESENSYEGRSLTDDGEIYTYDFLTSQPDMQVVQLPQVSEVRNEEQRVEPAKVVQLGMENARSVGTERAGKVYVKNRYTGRELWVTASSVRHGLNGRSARLLTNARLGSVIGDVVQNSIPINALHNTADGVEGTYAMAGFVRDEQGREFVAIITVEQRSDSVTGVDTYDLTHAVSGRQKRSKQANTKFQGVSPTLLASKISIAQLLEAVNDTYQSILSDNVLEHMGQTRSPEGHYTNRAKFSVDDSTTDETNQLSQRFRKESPDIRYSFAGESAFTADLDALNTAKQMLSEGVAEETVRQQTGWFKGMDGKWRWEIDDSQMEYRRDGDALFSQIHPEYARHEELMELLLSGDIAAGEEQELRQLHEIWGTERGRLRERTDRGGATLQNILKHDALFEAYPELRGVKVVFRDLPAGTHGQFSERTNTITLSNAVRKAGRNTLLHEIQHVIQNTEGFAYGASTEFWDEIQKGESPVRRHDRQLAKSRQRVEEIIAGLPEDAQKKFRRYILLDSMANLDGNQNAALELQALDEELMDSPYSDEFNEMWMELFDQTSWLGDRGKRGASDLYRNTAGEIEARNTADRWYMDEKTRREVKPDLGNGDTVFVEDWLERTEVPASAEDRYSASESNEQYLEAVTGNDMDTARQLVANVAEKSMPDSKLRTPDGKLRVVYHGTNTGDFTVFDPDYIGASSGDDGFFGRGFYFAFSSGEARYYGARRIIPAYLNLKNPFDFERELQTYRGQMARSGHAPDAVALMNFADKFPQIAESITVGVARKGESDIEDITLKEFAEAYKDVIEHQEFEYQEGTNEFGEPETLVLADPEMITFEFSGGTHTYKEYGFQRRFYGEPNALDVAYTYLENNVYEYIDLPSRTRVILDHNREFTSALKEMGYDGVVQSMDGDEAVAFEPNQIKSAEPVVYDDEGNVIPLSQRFDFRKDDIRYSVDDSREPMPEDFARIDAELTGVKWDAANAFLEERLGKEGVTRYHQYKRDQEQERKEAAKAEAKKKSQEKKQLRQEAMARIDQQMERSGQKKLDNLKPTQAKNNLVRTLLDTFSIPDGQKAELRTMISNYADRLLKNGRLEEQDYRSLFDRLYESGVMVWPAEEYFADARNYLKSGKIYVSDAVAAEFGDDWNQIRKQAFAAGIYLTRDSQTSAGGIDTWNGELASMLPGLFDADETDARTILERIIQVAEEGKDEHLSLAEYTARLAGYEQVSENELLDNLERQVDWALRTFTASAGIEMQVKEQTARERTKASEMRLKEIQRRAADREARKESARLAQERKEIKELQQKTLKGLQWLNANRNKAPEELRKVWDEVLADLDLYAVGAANELQWSNRYNATWKDLTQMLEDAQANDPNFIPSKELERIADRVRKRKLEDMDPNALRDLYQLVVGLQTEYHNRKNVINDEMQRLFAEVYADSKEEIQNAPGRFSGKKTDKFLNLDQLTPMNVLQRMGGWDPNGVFYSMARQLEHGERDMRSYNVRANRHLEQFLREHEDWVKKADGQGKDAIWYEVKVPELMELHMGDKPIFGDTVTVYMTPAQKVHLYLESKNTDNLRHMTGGRTFADKKLYSDGKRQEALAQGKTIRLAPETVKALVSDLTAEEQELANLLEQYYNRFATDEINRVSNILYGYDKAMGKNYAPIYTNQNYTKSEFGIFDGTAEGVGNLKERVKSKNPSYNISAFDAFERHVDRTARFVGMAIPARNWTTLMNWRETDNSTGDVITHKWGEETKRYIEDLITNLQSGGSFETETVGELGSKLQSNYISAVFGFNPSIVLKQLGSIPMGSAYLGMNNLPSPKQIRNIDRAFIGKYTRDLDWRTMGYATPETKHLKENPNWTQTNKIVRFLFGGDAITAMDGWAASVLWPWAENKVRREHPDLELGSQADIDSGNSPFWKKVAEEFEDALSRSQSVSDEIHQGTLRKSKNLFTRTFTLFRSDSAQTYNALRQKIGEAKFYARRGADQQTQRMAKKAVGNVVLSMMLNAVWAETISLLMAAWKNKAKYYRDDEDKVTVQSVMGEMVSNMIGSIAGVVTGGDTLAEVIGNILTGDKWYDLEAGGLEQLNEMFTATMDAAGGLRDFFAGAVDIISNDGDLGQYFGENVRDLLGHIKNVAKVFAQQIGGISVNNVEAYLIGALKWISPELGAAYDELWESVGKNDLQGLEGETLAGRIGRIMGNRNVELDDHTAEILSGLYESGYTKAIPADIPKSVKFGDESHELAEHQKQAYGNIWSGVVNAALTDLVSSEEFIGASAEDQEKLLNRLYDYAGEQAKSALFDGYTIDAAAEQVETLTSAGLGVADAVLWAWSTSGKKQTEKFAALQQWDIPEKAKVAVMGTLLGTDMETESGKPSQYAKFLDAMESGLSVDQYLDMRLGELDVDDYLEATAGGIDSDDAFALAKEMGAGDLDDLTKWRASVDFSDDVEDQLTALSMVMTDSQIRSVEIANAFGVVPEIYVSFCEIRSQYDADGNGSLKQTEVQAAIDSMSGLSTRQKAVLWQIMNSATSSAKNNPYSRAVGQQVLDAKAAAKELETEEEADSFYDELLRQMMGRG